MLGLRGCLLYTYKHNKWVGDWGVSDSWPTLSSTRVHCDGMQNCLAPITGMYIAVNDCIGKDTL